MNVPGQPGDIVRFESYDAKGRLKTLGVGRVERVTVQNRLSIMCDGRWAGAFDPDYCGTKFDTDLRAIAIRAGLTQVSKNLYRARVRVARMERD